MINFKKGVSTSLAITIIIVLAVLVGGGILAYQYYYLPKQETETPKIETPKDETADWKSYKNEEYGFEIKYPKDFTDLSENYICFSLPLEEIEMVCIYIDGKLSVPLPGTFGGRYPFKEDSDARDRVFSEEVVINDIVFKKDYWMAYGGMGSWDNVISCYTQHEDNYYMIELPHVFGGGVPGMVVEDRKITKEEIIDETLSEMRDEENEYVKIFNQMLSTFRFID